LRLEAGMDAPDFSAVDADGHRWTLSGLRGQKVILYFYPADDTRGCTVQACDFRDSQAEWKEAGYVVLGVSAQGTESHRAFTQKHSLNFPLLVDEDLSLADSYGARPEPKPGKGVPPVSNRSTFVIGEDGKIVDAQYGVKWEGHIDELRKTLAV
jgi:peroxiredoxin Q/BCP